MKFSFEQIVITEFGIGVVSTGKQDLYSIPVETEVKSALLDMAKSTIEGMKAISESPTDFDPSQKYSSNEHLYCSLDSSYVVFFKEMHNAVNLPIGMKALNEPSTINLYFARFTDGKGHMLTAIKRATQFKGVIKQKMIKILDDSFHLIPDRVFKLDNDFDLLVEGDKLLIYHPIGFTRIGDLEEIIKEAIPENVSIISKALPSVDFTNIMSYAMKHPKAGKYLASITSSGEMNNIDKDALISLCTETRVEIDASQSKILVGDKQIMGFLEVLDRRRYSINLVPNTPENYIAANRNKL